MPALLAQKGIWNEIIKTLIYMAFKEMKLKIITPLRQAKKKWIGIKYLSFILN